MNKTSIEWTHRPETGGPRGGFTWNPIRAKKRMLNGNFKSGTFCTRISPGCKNCYASRINMRFGTGAEYTVPNLANHEFFIDEKILYEPIKRKKPSTIFVGDMFDLFHEAISFDLILRVWNVICECPQHTFQLLTKRADRMLAFSRYVASGNSVAEWPRNTWLGVSVEDQQRADERIPLLLQTPAAVRFLSVEPQLEAVNPWITGPKSIDWIICGGESGPHARPFQLQWAMSLIEQCKAAGVPFFMKQTGINLGTHKGDRKGGDPSEWPEALRVREFPHV